MQTARNTAKVTNVLRDPQRALAGTAHEIELDPELDYYDYVNVERVLRDAIPASELTHAEQVACTRVILGRGGTQQTVMNTLDIDKRAAEKLITEHVTGDCACVRATCRALGCGSQWITTNRRSAYCSEACRQTRGRKPILPLRVCVEASCGATYQPIATHQRFCSTKCQSRESNRRLRGAASAA